MNQGERILDYLCKHESITPMQAFDELGITKLSTRIGELIREGWPIEKEYEKGKNRFGEQVCYMKYFMRN